MLVFIPKLWHKPKADQVLNALTQQIKVKEAKS